MSHHEQMWAPRLGFCPCRGGGGLFNALWAREPGSPSVLEEARVVLAAPAVCWAEGGVRLWTCRSAGDGSSQARPHHAGPAVSEVLQPRTPARVPPGLVGRRPWAVGCPGSRRRPGAGAAAWAQTRGGPCAQMPSGLMISLKYV